MMTKLEIKNFKAFRTLQLTISPLTVLTGLNSTGKSSVLQALLLLKQSYGEASQGNNLILNGAYLNLGLSNDILNEKTEEELIEINYSADGKTTKLPYKAALDASELVSNRSQFPLLKLRIFLQKMHYISAARITPASVFDLSGRRSSELDFGIDGRFAISYLSDHFDMIVSHQHLQAGLQDKTLSNLTNYWMRKVSPDVKVEPSINPKNRTAELYYSFAEGDYVTRSFKSTNVGFGVTHVLPIIVQILAAQKGDILLIENPESHLHPAGQSMLGKMFACAAADGIQIIAETHSDHVINGIRLAVIDQIIHSNNVAIKYFFRDVESDYEHRIKELKMNDAGQLDEWPEGFMDEWEKALSKLIFGE